MPNGTIGHFRLKCSELVDMLSEFDADTVIGDVVGWGDSISALRPLTVASLKQIAQEAAEDQQIVFEQDDGDYSIPFSGRAFVSIDEKSVFYERLVRCHDEYKVKLKLMAEQWRQSLGEEPKDDSNS